MTRRPPDKPATPQTARQNALQMVADEIEARLSLNALNPEKWAPLSWEQQRALLIQAEIMAYELDRIVNNLKRKDD